MTRIARITPKFVEFIPKTIEDGVLYISEEYATASHNCACGCGSRVVTPLTPTDWKVRVRKGAVSVSPSIGNWDYACRSHYWIRDNQILWAPVWSAEEIAAGRERDWEKKQAYYSSLEGPSTGRWLSRTWAWIKEGLLGSNR